MKTIFPSMIVFLFIFSARAERPDEALTPNFDACVHQLHRVGGVSLRLAQNACLRPLSQEILNCQNRNFLFAFRDARESLVECVRNPSAGAGLRGELYHGVYEPLESLRPQKQTVCSITVNSFDERDIFRANLDPNRFNWIELLPERETSANARFIVRDDHWMKRACAAKIRCDVLVVSGHFAESFLGDAGFEIPLKELTKASCGSDCRDLFGSVKEVYLFGCNTLAERRPDARSITQYIDVLTVDGVPPHRAQRVSARRYTDYGASIAEEMRSLFPSANSVYGFPTVSPSGKNVSADLREYVKAGYATDDASERAKIFSKTLAQAGMIRLSARPPLCEEAKDVLRSPSLRTKAGLLAFKNLYAEMMPVPVVDVLVAGRDRGLLTEQEWQGLRTELLNRWNKIPYEIRRQRVCPVMLTEHGPLFPEWKPCLQDYFWMS